MQYLVGTEVHGKLLLREKEQQLNVFFGQVSFPLIVYVVLLDVAYWYVRRLGFSLIHRGGSA